METGEWSERERIGGRGGFLFSSSPLPFIPLFYSRANFLELALKSRAETLAMQLHVF